MIIKATIKTGSKDNLVVRQDNGDFVVLVKEIPIENRANTAAIKLLARHFNIPKSCVSLVRGAKSKIKFFEVIV